MPKGIFDTTQDTNNVQPDISSGGAYSAMSGNQNAAPPQTFAPSMIDGDFALGALRSATSLHTQVKSSPSGSSDNAPKDTIVVPQNELSRMQVISQPNTQSDTTGGNTNPNRTLAPQLVSQAGSAIKDIGIGALKGAGRIAVGLGSIGAKVLEGVYGKDAVTKSGMVYEQGTPENKAAMSALTDTNTMQSVGDWGTQIAAFFVPGLDVAGAETALASATANLPTYVGVAARIFGNAAIEAGQGAAMGYVESGGDPEAAKTGALTFGATKLGTGIAGEALKATGVPLRIYSRIFSNTADDLASEWTGKAADQIKAQNPKKYEEMLNSGAIKVGEDGNVSVNRSVAQHMLETNVKGSAQNMGILVASRLLKNEDDVQKTVQGFGGTVSIDYPDNLVNVLRTTASKLVDVADNKYTNLANELADKIESTTRDPETGKIISNTAEIAGSDALTLRRFLDSMRSESSFDKSLLEVGATGQKNYKFLSDKVRTSMVDAMPSLGSVMQDYSYNIRGLEQLSRFASSKEHAALFSMWDALIFDTGLAGGGIGLGAMAGIGRRAADTGIGLTTLAQSIEQGTQTALGKIIRGGLTAVQNTPSGQEQQ